MLPERFTNELAQTHLEDTYFWGTYFGDLKKAPFDQVLERYATYHSQLNHAQKTQLSQVFWAYIDNKKLPIIRMSVDDCTSQVFFLFQKKSDDNNDLYLQGDFHGYGSTLESQKLNRYGQTDIMYCESTIPKDALVTYLYTEVATSYHNQMPSFFYGNMDEYPNRPKLFSKSLADPYRKHSKPYNQDGFFCVNAENDISHLRLSPVDWHELLGRCSMNLLCDKNDNLVVDPNDITKDYMSQLFSTEGNYAKYRRSIHVFTPPGKIDRVVIFNDVMLYHLGNTVERIERVSENTAMIFVTTLPKLFTDYKGKVDATSKLPGMRERAVDYHYCVQEYASFLINNLIPNLKKKGINLPNDVTLVGSSLSGTASLYMGLKYPKYFNKVIAQSPSPTNEQLIVNMNNIRAHALTLKIDLTCGKFEDSELYAKNHNLSVAEKFSKLLGVPVRTGWHGHQIEAWAPDLERSVKEGDPDPSCSQTLKSR